MMKMKKEKQKIVVWGGGNYYFQYKGSIEEKYTVMAIVDTYNAACLNPTALRYLKYDKLLIMVRDIKTLFDVINQASGLFGVPFSQISYGQQFFSDSIDERWGSIDDEGRLELGIRDFSLKISSYNEYYNVRETLWNTTYEYRINNGKEDVVIDIGMNIGDSTLFFLNENKVKKVIAFEPFARTYKNAIENVKEYIMGDRLIVHQYGLGDVTEKRIIRYNRNMTCAQSTDYETRDYVADKFEKTGMINRTDDIIEEISIVSAAAEVGAIVGKYGERYNIVLKMDCEGEEYKILDDLDRNCVLKEIDFIMMEWHYHGCETIIKFLCQNGFSYWQSRKSNEMGLIYAYNTGKLECRDSNEVILSEN